ncbi:MAG: phospho-N-acetylmuramoyl-pentapeptide-transferase, partial [Vallitaleaceae bacterium]|nr:phospho-N-acetylmuramoyl-pentapeptide-transferase [Vallitaleaceae bacterium]
MNTDFIVPILIAFIVTVVLLPTVIPFLTKLKFGQFVRHDGPKTHLKKSGTPTMGGIVIVVGILLTSLFFVNANPDIVPILYMTIGFGVLGFMDDFVKVVMKRSLGLRAYQKVIGQLLISGFYCYYVYKHTLIGTQIMIPFSGGQFIDLGMWFIPFLLIVILGTVNGTNLTDGLDGLASSITILVATYFTVVSIGLGSGISPITGAAAGSLLAFLLFNSHPAKVFMGDTGSLALGGFVVATAISLKMPLFILIVGFIYL